MNRNDVIIHKYQWTTQSIGELLDLYGSAFIAENIGSLYMFEKEYRHKDIEDLKKLPRIDISSKHAITIQKYTRRFLIKNNMTIARKLIEQNVDFEVDMITYNRIEEPILIASDWIDGNKIIYDESTIRQCALVDEVAEEYYLDENGMQQTKVKKSYVHTDDGYRIYKSPFTRNLFTIIDFHYLSHKQWYKFGLLMLKQMNLKNIQV